ncbi:MAG: hypothetical protein IH598_00650 [Bacteroidales bacterium]|nr:hypothetical protein [Bacteroidales bacterium]
MKNAVKFKQIIQSLIADNTDPGKIEKAKQELSILIQTNFSQSFNKACSDEGMLFRIRLIEQDDCEKWRKVLPIFHNERATFNLDQIERILKRSLEKIYDDLIQVELKNDFGLHGNSFNSKWFGSFISDIVKNHLNDSLSALFHDRIASFNEAVKKEFSIN